MLIARTRFGAHHLPGRNRRHEAVRQRRRLQLEGQTVRRDALDRTKRRVAVRVALDRDLVARRGECAHEIREVHLGEERMERVEHLERRVVARSTATREREPLIAWRVRARREAPRLRTTRAGRERHKEQLVRHDRGRSLADERRRVVRVVFVRRLDRDRVLVDQICHCVATGPYVRVAADELEQVARKHLHDLEIHGLVVEDEVRYRTEKARRLDAIDRDGVDRQRARADVVATGTRLGGRQFRPVRAGSGHQFGEEEVPIVLDTGDVPIDAARVGAGRVLPEGTDVVRPVRCDRQVVRVVRIEEPSVRPAEHVCNFDAHVVDVHQRTLLNRLATRRLDEPQTRDARRHPVERHPHRAGFVPLLDIE